MRRSTDPRAFRAEAVLVSWPQVVRPMLANAGNEAGRYEAAFERQGEVQLRWAVSDAIGLAPAPFTIWVRQDDKLPLKALDFGQFGFGFGGSSATGITWLSEPMAAVDIAADPIDSTQPVVFWAFGRFMDLQSAVAAQARPAGPGRVSALLKAGTIVCAAVVNGTNVAVSGATLDDTVNVDGWREVEWVGLPVNPGDWAAGYDTSPQGPVVNPTDPVSAAVARLKRGAPPVGWYSHTQAGRVAPMWAGVDPGWFVDEVRKLSLPDAEALFGVAPQAQGQVSVRHPVAAPVQDGRSVGRPSVAVHRPLASVLLAGSTEACAALALGFGTCYPLDSHDDPDHLGEQVRGGDFLVTADYPAGLDGASDPVTYAAYGPWPGLHARTASPTGLAAARSGLVNPAVRDGDWRESVRLSWDRVEPVASAGRPTVAVTARYESAGAAAADCLQEVRDSGGFRPFAVARRLVSSDPVPVYSDRADWSDAGAPIPRGSGGRHVGYALAVADVFGIWSPWRDVAYDGTEPAPPVPKVVSARLDTAYAGSTTCLGTLEVHLTIDWAARSPMVVWLLGVLVPVGSPTGALPAGVTPLGPAPAGGTRVDRADVVAAGGVLFPGGSVEVGYLDPAGQVISPVPDAAHLSEDPASPSDRTRHYRLTVRNIPLDFAAANHYALAVWGRESDITGPGGVAVEPVVARVSSPVPVLPAVVAPPVVPLGSAPDPAGRSHARLAWGLGGGSVSVTTLWCCSETALRAAAGLGPIPAGPSLSDRYVALKAAYDDPGFAGRRRAVFRRETQFTGPATTAEVLLPRGSDEIHLYAVTTANAGNVESPWPQTSAELLAVAAPRFAVPASPEVLAVPAAGSVAVSVSVGGTVPPARVDLYRTSLDAAAALGLDAMGPAVVSAPLVPVGGRWTATVADVLAPSWRTVWYRAVAWGADDPLGGVVGQRSAPSAAFPLLAPPAGAPDLSVPAVTLWGAAHDGVLVACDTDLPPQAGRLGASGVDAAVTVDTGGPAPDPPLVSRADRLDRLLVDDSGAPPADVTGGVLVRGVRAAGRTPLRLWLQRAATTDALTVTLTVTDPLGRSARQVVAVPGFVPPDPPDLVAGAPLQLGALAALPFTSRSPRTATPLGPYAVAAIVSRSFGFFPPPLRLRVDLPDVPEIASTADIPPATQIGVFRDAADPDRYVLVAARARPVRFRLAVLGPDGQRADADVTF